MNTKISSIAAVSLAACTALNAAAQKPDIFVIFTDQWSPRETPRWGTQAKTPNLDAIAGEGMRFYNAYSPCPVCMPARTCLLTGQYPHNTGLWGNTTGFAPLVWQAKLFSDVKDQGYTTAQIGKLHWLSGQDWKKQAFASSAAFFSDGLKLDHAEEISSPFSTGANPKGAYADYLRKLGKLDAYVADISSRLKGDNYLVKASVAAAGEHNEDFVAARAIEFLESQPADQPLFLVASWFGPHNPMDAPEPYASMYKPEDMKPLPNIKFPYKYDDKQIDKAQWQRIKANYLGKITHIDDCVGRVVEALKKRGNWDNTLVIFISDHGEMMGSHGYMTKGRFYEESAGIPMWVRPPKGTQVAAKETDVPVNLVDVYATVVEMAGGEMTAQRFSNSLLPIVRGEKKYDPQQATFSEIYHRQGLSHMVRKGDYKWFYQEGVERLYNLKKDPYELNNLINDSAHAAKVREMKDTYHDWMMKTQINYAEGYKPMAVRAREQAARGKK